MNKYVTRARNIIRHMAVHTAGNPLLSFFSRAFYYTALKFFVRYCAKYPEIKSVYLRNSFTDKAWVPGLSDIDATVVIRNGLSAEQEFCFLKAFWLGYKKLKSAFPVLDIPEVLSAEDLDLWARFKTIGHEAEKWKLVYGSGTGGNINTGNNHHLKESRLIYAVQIYLNYFTEYFFKQSAKTGPAPFEAQRAGCKILRYTDSGRNSHNTLFQKQAAREDKYIFFNRVLKALNNSILDMRKNAALPAIAPASDETEAIISNAANPRKIFVVMGDAPGAAAISSAIKAHALALNIRDFRVYFVTRVIFDYIINFYDPFQYIEFLQKKKIIYGKDPLPGTEVPAINAFIERAAEETVSIFTHSRSMRVVLSSPLKSFCLSRFYEYLKAYSEADLFFKNKTADSRAKETLREYAGLFLPYRQDVENFTHRTGVNAKEASNKECFLLLRRLSEKIRKLARKNYAP
ncbi:MAG: hypothetical protein JW946_05080 [Candidatus Omnitrophica bacterium]|nr:hypothetical protein [Candidatus Omnitrophota bacterium]